MNPRRPSYIPWHRIARKLVPDNPLVVTFTRRRAAGTRGTPLTRCRSAIYPEVMDDIPPAIDRVLRRFQTFGSAGDAARGHGEPGGVRRRTRGCSSLRRTPRTRRRNLTESRRARVVTYADGKETPLKNSPPMRSGRRLNEGGEWKGTGLDGAAPRCRETLHALPRNRRAICPW